MADICLHPSDLGPCAGKSGSGCHVVIRVQRVAGFYPDVDVCDKTDGFVQAEMKDDKQAEAFAERRVSEFIPEARAQNSPLIILDERVASRFHEAGRQHAAAGSSAAALSWSLSSQAVNASISRSPARAVPALRGLCVPFV